MNLTKIYRQNKEPMDCESIHPYNNERFNLENAKTLIIGSIPAHRFSEPKNLLIGIMEVKITHFGIF